MSVSDLPSSSHPTRRTAFGCELYTEPRAHPMRRDATRGQGTDSRTPRIQRCGIAVPRRQLMRRPPSSSISSSTLASPAVCFDMSSARRRSPKPTNSRWCARLLDGRQAFNRRISHAQRHQAADAPSTHGACRALSSRERVGRSSSSWCQRSRRSRERRLTRPSSLRAAQGHRWRRSAWPPRPEPHTTRHGDLPGDGVTLRARTAHAARRSRADVRDATRSFVGSSRPG